ncbi:hypothetical protein [Erwinia sp. E602]|nr:hypothetical protein [Erwinia sp. E602]
MMNAAILCALLLAGGPLMGFLVIIAACLSGMLLERLCHRHPAST